MSLSTLIRCLIYVMSEHSSMPYLHDVGTNPTLEQQNMRRYCSMNVLQ
jgi:hypothetical protein